jgi:uncharacterized protein YdaU (DUF1376 family)
MKLFWGDYHKATRHLSRDQHGAYLLLIGEAWRLGGALPDDDRLLAAWTLCTAQEWGAMRDTILAFFAFRRGKWVHDRVREELAHYEDVSRKRKSAGKTGGSTTHGKDTQNPEAIAMHLPTKPEPEPETDTTTVAKAPVVVRIEQTPKPKATKRCPAAWSPSEADLAVGAAEGFTPGEIDRELAKIRDHQFRDAHSDWGAVFRGWIRRAAEHPSRKALNRHERPDQPSAKLAAKQANMDRSFRGAQSAAARRAI